MAMLCVGNQRSYSDVCRLDGGDIVRSGKHIHFFNKNNGVLSCEAGLSINELLPLITAHGWMFPVVPGTSHATIGGCIANDVHGKNQQTMGSFGHHIIYMKMANYGPLMDPCFPLFQATVGGLGLTGKIDCVTLQLYRPSHFFMPYYFPLDYIPYYWPLYKRLGFWQFHCVVPPNAVKKVFLGLSQPPFLIVRKTFGDISSVGMLSFCRPGIGLSFDFVHKNAVLARKLENIVIEAGGACYPAKYSMSTDMFHHSFPRWREFAKYVDPGFSSNFWRRVSSE